MIGYKNHTEAVTARQKLHKMNVVELGGLSYKIPHAVGYPYIITTNIDVEDDIVNAVFGVFTKAAQFRQALCVDRGTG
ncbi:hypothetical protein TNCV_2603571 [Trichonephila clavipes]|nr:hypothetical protein TNCV_2603571 [Trichonephila clavipes]